MTNGKSRSHARFDDLRGDEAARLAPFETLPHLPDDPPPVRAAEVGGEGAGAPGSSRASSRPQRVSLEVHDGQPLPLLAEQVRRVFPTAWADSTRHSYSTRRRASNHRSGWGTISAGVEAGERFERLEGGLRRGRQHDRRPAPRGQLAYCVGDGVEQARGQGLRLVEDDHASGKPVRLPDTARGVGEEALEQPGRWW